MFAARMRRCLFVCAAVASIAAVTLPAQSANLQREKEARALLAEGEKLDAATLLNEALSVFERVRKEYPDTEAGLFADFWRAQVLARMGRTKEGTEIDLALIAKHPGTVLACWAQYGIAAMIGGSPEGIAEMRKVREMLPNRADFGPFDLSRVVMGEWVANHIAWRGDVLDAASFFGLDKSKPKERAEALAIVAAHTARVQGLAKARPILDRLASECPDEREEIAWARVQAALACLDPPEPPLGTYRPAVSREAALELGGLAERMLTAYLAEAALNDDEAARAAIALAGYYRRTERLVEAVTVLKEAATKHADTGHGAQVVYEYGRALNRQGRIYEAAKALKQLAANKPLSTYAAMAVAMAESIETTCAESAKPLAALIKEAEAAWDPKWESLACSPDEGALDAPVMVARQVLALAKKELYESALSTIDSFATRSRLSPTDSLRARGELALYSLRTTSDLVKLWKHGDVLVPVFGSLPAGSGPECERIQVDLIRSVSEFVHGVDERRLPPEQRASCLLAIGEGLSRLKLHREALVAFKDVRKLRDASDEAKALATYQSGLCYRAIGYHNSGRRCMDEVISLYPDSQRASSARKVLYTWSTE